MQNSSLDFQLRSSHSVEPALKHECEWYQLDFCDNSVLAAMMQDIGYIITISIGKCLGDTLNVFQCDLTNPMTDEDLDTESIGIGNNTIV